MIIVIDRDATQDQIERIRREVAPYCTRINESTGREHIILGLIGLVDGVELEDHLMTLEAVEEVVRISTAYKLVALASTRGVRSVVRIGDVPFGGGYSPVIAGPCAVESYEQMHVAAMAVKQAGAKVLRGEPLKSRTGPHSFQGLGEEGFQILANVSAKLEMPYVAEVLEVSDIELALKYGAACIRVGTRNMGNSALLRALGQIEVPVMLKRGMAATYDDWLQAAEFIADGGNQAIILCERGIRTFEPHTRNTLDLAAIPAVQRLSHLPIIVDPSHAVGLPHAIPSMAYAATAAGADGLMIDVHPEPSQARVDGKQAVTPRVFQQIMTTRQQIATAVGLEI